SAAARPATRRGRPSRVTRACRSGLKSCLLTGGLPTSDRGMPSGGLYPGRRFTVPISTPGCAGRDTDRLQGPGFPGRRAPLSGGPPFAFRGVPAPPTPGPAAGRVGWGGESLRREFAGELPVKEGTMLVLTRKVGERLVIGGITVQVLATKGR